MFKNYLKTALRNLLRQRLFTGLNIAGLAIGMTCSILIFLWVRDERSYDRATPDADRIYRITTHLSGIDAAVVPIPFAMAVKQSIPAVESVSRISTLKCFVTVGTAKFDEQHMFYADSNFVTIFGLQPIAGDKTNLLRDPSTIVLTETAAKKYFGSVDAALSKTIHIDNSPRGIEQKITTIIADPAVNSHLQYSMLLPIRLYENTQNMKYAWGNYDVFTYVKMAPGFEGTTSQIASMERQINDVLKQNDNTHTKASFSLQHLTDIHLTPQILLDTEGHGNKQYVTIFSVVAVIILLIACINFMNLATALSGRRAREVGLRKTVGALRTQLIAQFLGESLLLTIISLVIAIALVTALIPLFNTLAAKSITLNLLDAKLVLALIGTVLGVGLIAGSYPAFFLSSFNPIKVLKGVKQLHGGKSFFRNGLVVLQFSVSIILMVATITVYRQLNYIHKRDIGYDKQNLLYISLPTAGDLSNNYRAVKAALSDNTDTGEYTIISHLPTYLTTGTTTVEWPKKAPGDQIIFPQLWVDNNFIKTFGIRMAAGRSYEESYQGDDSSIVINETAARIMQMTPANAVGQQISYNDHKKTIIGVMKDFNFKPVQNAIEPLVLHKTGKSGDMSGNAGFIVVRTSPANLQNKLSQIRASFGKAYESYPFTYGFIDSDLNAMYAAEQQMGNVFNAFSILSVFISCLGLFGLATFATQRRVKEIGVRKVLGAGEAGIVAMLSKEFITLVAIALVIGCPLAGWVMHRWLNSFVYRIDLSWWVFVLAGALSILIALVTVSWQSIRAATANPIESLRSE